MLTVRPFPVLFLAALVALPSLTVVGPALAGEVDALDVNADGKVVIAILDTGINPYHQDFRDPARTAHPSTYLDGFPADTPSLDLTFGNGYDASRTADAALWDGVAHRQLYWIPGTKIVGAISTGDPPSGGALSPNQYPEERIIDDNGHGTGASSAALGNTYGACPDCLLVAVEGTGSGLDWAADQPWIDIISSSWGALGNAPLGSQQADSARAARAGKIVLFAASNGFTNTGLLPDRETTLLSPTSGPGWVITVGASTPNGDDYFWHGWPVDVVSVGNNWPTASGFSITGEQRFGGTSCATPIVAGSFGRALLALRETFGDTASGPRDQNLVVPADDADLPSSGPMADGVLARYELEDAIFRTATDPGRIGVRNIFAVPWHPGYHVWTGWGYVNKETADAAIPVLLGDEPAPQREDVETWMNAQALVRSVIWGNIHDRPNALQPADTTVSRGTIEILGDDDFTPGNGVIGGTGAAEDPYVIGGWRIDVSKENAIVIRNTDKHWLVAGNVLTSEFRVGTGIVADSAGNGRVLGNHLHGFGNGMQILDQGIEVRRNIFESVTNGITVRNAGPVIRDNDFLSFSTYGVIVSLPWDPRATEDAEEPTLIDASYNYWGTDKPYPHRHYVGPFKAFPWYSTPGHDTVGPGGYVSATIVADAGL